MQGSAGVWGSKDPVDRKWIAIWWEPTRKLTSHDGSYIFSFILGDDVFLYLAHNVYFHAGGVDWVHRDLWKRVLWAALQKVRDTSLTYNLRKISLFSFLQAIPSKRSQKVVFPCWDRAARWCPICQWAPRTPRIRCPCISFLWKCGFCEQPSAIRRRPYSILQQPAKRRSKPKSATRQRCPKLQQHQRHHQVDLFRIHPGHTLTCPIGQATSSKPRKERLRQAWHQL